MARGLELNSGYIKPSPLRERKQALREEVPDQVYTLQVFDSRITARRFLSLAKVLHEESHKMVVLHSCMFLTPTHPHAPIQRLALQELG
jgi:hypothetical protein